MLRKIAGLEPVHHWLHKAVPMALLGTLGSVGRSWAGRASARTEAGQDRQTGAHVGAEPEGKEPSGTCRIPLPCEVTDHGDSLRTVHTTKRKLFVLKATEILKD